MGKWGDCMEKRFFNIEDRFFNVKERTMNNITFWATIAVCIIGYLFVMLFLEGTRVDAVVLLMVFGVVVIKLFERFFGGLAKYFYISWLPIGGAVTTVVTNDGKYGGITQCLFLWLLLAASYSEAMVVKVCAVTTLLANTIGIYLFTDTYLKLNTIVVWGYIAIVYTLAACIAYLIAKKSRHLFEMEQQIEVYERETEYFQELQKKDEKNSRFIHDIDHYLKAIGELAKEKDYTCIEGILKELNVEIEKNATIIYTHRRLLNAVLVEKRAEAKENGIAFEVNVEPNIDLKPVSDGDLVVIFGNLLDNAIRAVANMKKRQKTDGIKVQIYKERDGKIYVIKIINPFEGEVRTNQNGFISSKRKGKVNGIGIKSVERTVKRYNGCLQCSTENNVFSAVIVLPV